MNKLILTLSPLLYCHAANAGFIQYFKDENNETKWQYVANFSSAVLIVLLSVTAISLFFSHRRATKANKALKEIRDMLEQRVRERTATLDESNGLLKESNRLLGVEISEHKETTARLKVSEAYIKNILQSMPSMLIGLDGEMNVTQWNQCAEETTGVSHEKAHGRNLWDAYPTITISPDQVKQVLEHNKPVAIEHSQRGQYYFDITIYPLQGELETGVVILVDNVTQRTLAENKLIHRDKISAMGELASTMAHDIDTPIQAILEDLETLKGSLPGNNGSSESEADNNAKLIALIDDAKERGQQTSHIIRNLLDFSQLHSGNKRPAQVTDIIDHTLELAQTILSDLSGLKFQDIQIERSYEEKLPTLPCFESELQQVFLSLFRHACHALGAATGRENFDPVIKIDVQECYDALWIKIQHNGLGLTAEEQQDIFEPFFNTVVDEKSTSAEDRLSFSHFIVTDHHQGQIAVTSDVNVGSTFHIQFQLRD